MESIGWSSIPVSNARLSVRTLGPISVAKMQRARVIHFDKLKQLQWTLKTISLIIEPAPIGVSIYNGKEIPFSFTTDEGQKNAINLFTKAGFHQSMQHFAHSKTAIIDLRNSEDELLKSFPQITRHNIKKALKSQVQYASIPFSQLTQTQQQEFHALHNSWAKERNIFGFSNSFLDVIFTSFPQNGFFISARHDGTLIGAMLVLIHDHVGYYFYTCSTALARSLRVPSGLTHMALQQSRASGCDIFDFCSVYDERYPRTNIRWKGFTTYKFRFNPTAVYYPPTFVRGIF